MTKQRDDSDLRTEHNGNRGASTASGEPPARLDACGSAEPGSIGATGRAERIRVLNDRLRQHGVGGMVLVTDGIAALEPDIVRAILAAVAAFDGFNADNDPWGEHDCASLEVDGVSVIFKIDYYDRQRQFHSPDPADPKLTVRVLTIMRADEY